MSKILVAVRLDPQIVLGLNDFSTRKNITKSSIIERGISLILQFNDTLSIQKEFEGKNEKIKYVEVESKNKQIFDNLVSQLNSLYNNLNDNELSRVLKEKEKMLEENINLIEKEKSLSKSISDLKIKNELLIKNLDNITYKYKTKSVKTKRAFGYKWVKETSWKKQKQMLQEIKEGQRRWNKKQHCWEVMHTLKWRTERLLLLAVEQ